MGQRGQVQVIKADPLISVSRCLLQQEKANDFSTKHLDSFITEIVPAAQMHIIVRSIDSRNVDNNAKNTKERTRDWAESRTSTGQINIKE